MPKLSCDMKVETYWRKVITTPNGRQVQAYVLEGSTGRAKEPPPMDHTNDAAGQGAFQRPRQHFFFDEEPPIWATVDTKAFEDALRRAREAMDLGMRVEFTYRDVDR